MHMLCYSLLITMSPRGRDQVCHLANPHKSTVDTLHSMQGIKQSVSTGLLSCYHSHNNQTFQTMLSMIYPSPLPSIDKVDHEVSRMAIHRIPSASTE